jgi:hypothetical protein
MITKTSSDDYILEVICDICGLVTEDQDEIEEFKFFNYETGPNAVNPNCRVMFDVCQECFIDAFPEVFENNKHIKRKDLN